MPHAPEFYAEMGRKGRTGGFASKQVGADGKTGRQRAVEAGKRGGLVKWEGNAASRQKKLAEAVELVQGGMSQAAASRQVGQSPGWLAGAKFRDPDLKKLLSL